MWRLTKQVRFVAPTMRAVPMDWIIKTADEGTKIFFRYLQVIFSGRITSSSATDYPTSQENMNDTTRLMAELASSTGTSDDKGSRTIVHEIMASKLPPAEKKPERVFEDVSTVAGAAFETTASVLRMVLFHVFSNTDMLQRLRAELASIDGDPATVDLKLLEQLPYLTSVLKEGLRLSPGIATRMARISPDRSLFYKEWEIPAGTPVGMTAILIHTDEANYPDPKRFDPERWMERDGRKADEKAFMPFAKGTRNCIGMQ
jgi:cytochrome P450